jgi:microtubule-associated protein-like 6
MRKWSIHDKSMLETVGLGVMARACAYDPRGDVIAVGFGGRVGTGKQKQDGLVRLYTNSNLRQLCEVSDAKQWISDIKFSPDGRTLAVGSHNNSIYLYRVNISGSGDQMTGSLTLKTKFSKHNSYITHFDFSTDGRFLQSNCGAYELLFSDTSSGKQITSASELKDVKWASWTCTLGWPVQGIWPPLADGTDINAVDRSHSGHLLATVDDFGKVNLCRYPCLPNAKSTSYFGHSSHVMNVRWSRGDQYLISVGGNDKCVFQWKHVLHAHNDASEGTASQSSESVALGGASNEFLDMDFESDGPGAGDEAGAIKPWLGAIRAPKVPPTLNDQAPTTSLELSWVHGYTSATSGEGYRVSSNLFYNASGEIVYPAASLGVKMRAIPGSNSSSIIERSQQYFNGHDDDIICLTMSSDRRFVATGQTASKGNKGKAHICIWDAVDCRLLTKLSACHDNAVVSLAFNREGNKLVSVGRDNGYTHILWEDRRGGWSQVTQQASLRSDGKPVLFSRWIASGDTSDSHFVSGGGSSVIFWKVEGAALSRSNAKFGSFASQTMVCIANLNTNEGWRMIAGASNGDLYVFKDRQIVKSHTGAHKDAILCLQEVLSISNIHIHFYTNPLFNFCFVFRALWTVSLLSAVVRIRPCECGIRPCSR